MRIMLRRSALTNSAPGDGARAGTCQAGGAGEGAGAGSCQAGGGLCGGILEQALFSNNTRHSQAHNEMFSGIVTKQQPRTIIVKLRSDPILERLDISKCLDRFSFMLTNILGPTSFRMFWCNNDKHLRLTVRATWPIPSRQIAMQ